MNSKTSSHKIKTIIRNDLKRFWVIAVAAFIVHFFSTLAPVILNMSKKDSAFLDSLIRVLCDFSSAGDIAVTFALPIFAALSVFKYMNHVASVTAVHSLPVSRKQLILGHTVSGYILCIVPVVLIKLLTVLITLHINNVDTAGMLITAVAMLISMLFIYAVALLSCMLCGTTLMAVVGAIGLNILPPSLGVFFSYYGSHYLVGYSPTALMTAMCNAAPLFGLTGFGPDRHGLALTLVIYVIVSAIILAAGYLLYTRRKMENATEPLAFRFMVPIVCALLTFFLSSVAAMMFEDNIPFAAGLALFGIIVYIFSRMFTLKTTRIFNRQTVISFAIYALIIAVIVSGYAFDITGYSKKTADIDKTVSASTDIMTKCVGDSRIWEKDGGDIMFSTPENIKALQELHQYCIDNVEKTNSAVLLDAFGSYSTFTFTYGNNKEFKRHYEACPTNIRDCEAVKKIYESEEFKDYFAMEMSPSEMRTATAEIWPAWDSVTGSAAASLNNEKTRELIEALEKDFQERTYEQAVNGRRLGRVEITTTSLDGHFYNIAIYKTDKHTLKWLKENTLFSLLLDDYQVITKIKTCIGNDDYKTVDTKAVGMTLAEFFDTYGEAVEDGTFDTYGTVDIYLKDKMTEKKSEYLVFYDKEHFPDLK